MIMIAPLSSPKQRTRLTKQVLHFNKYGYRINFWGWERIPGESGGYDNDQKLVVRSLLLGGGYTTRKARLMYPLWMVVVFWRVLFLGRCQTIFCLGWETAFPARLAALITNAQIVFDDADRFSMIFNLPGFLHRMLQRLERWTSHKCALHIVPGFSRYEWRHERMILLRNTPLRRDFETARKVAPDRPDAKLVLYANGWIGETRGAATFLKALNRASRAGLDLHMVIAGQVDGPNGEKLCKHPLVSYLGRIVQREALSWYAVVDAVLTFYYPSVPINHKAEPNKWGDAIYFNTPFIVNSEVETARDFVDQGAAFSVPYNDEKGLFHLLAGLVDAPERISRAKEEILKFEASFQVFDDGLTNILRRLEKRRI